jgi:hypothetical protein
MLLFVAIAIALVLVGAIGIHTRRGRFGIVGFFLGLLALVSGMMMLYLAYLTTTDDFGR